MYVSPNLCNILQEMRYGMHIYWRKPWRHPPEPMSNISGMLYPLEHIIFLLNRPCLIYDFPKYRSLSKLYLPNIMMNINFLKLPSIIQIYSGFQLISSLFYRGINSKIFSWRCHIIHYNRHRAKKVKEIGCTCRTM